MYLRVLAGETVTFNGMRYGGMTFLDFIETGAGNMLHIPEGARLIALERQLLLRPLVQSFRQVRILRVRTPGRFTTHWCIVGTILQLIRYRRCRPELVLCALWDAFPENRPDNRRGIPDQRIRFSIGTYQIRAHDARMQRDRFDGRVFFRERAGEENVGKFGLTITGPGPLRV